MKNGRVREWLVRLRNVFWASRGDRDLQDELALHAALEAEHDPSAAGHAGVVRAMDALRDQRGVPSLEHLFADVRHAVRSLRRSPWFVAAAVATLTLGTAANAAVFSLVNSIVFKPLPMPRSEQLMLLTTRVPSLGFDEFWVSPPEYFEFSELNRSFASVGAYRPGEVNIAAAVGPQRVRALSVDHHLLRTVGVAPLHGRWFDAQEAHVQGPPVAILSYELWRSAFGGRMLVGDTIDVDGGRRRVVGIMPPGTDVMDQRAQVWLPLGLNPADRSNRATHSLYVVGRLKDGVTEAAARTELADLMMNWGARAGVKGAGIAGHVFSPVGLTLPPGVAAPGHVLQMVPMKERLIGSARRSVWAVQIAVAGILLIACANLASVLLARAESRRHELAIRAAIGASRVRLMQLFVVEGLLLSLAAGTLGLVVASAAMPWLAREYLSGLPRAAEIAVEPIVVIATAVVSVAAGIIFGVTPLVQLNLKQLANAIRSGDGRVGPARRQLATAALVMAQVTIAVTVTVAAILFVRTIRNLAAVDGGFDRSQIVTFSISVPPAAYATGATRLQFYQRTLDAVRAMPGVQAASAMSGLPLDRMLDARGTDMEGYTAAPDGTPEIVDYYQTVMSSYFDTMRIPLVKGRAFEPADAAAQGMVAIVNETLARTFWKDQDPIGRRLRPCCADTIPWYTVIGVARDVPQQTVDRKPGSEIYYFAEQVARVAVPASTMNVVVRTTLAPGELRPQLQQAVAALDPTIPVVRLRSMDRVFDDSIRRPHLLARLFGACAVVALVLSAVGLYGLLAYLVVQRRKEIVIRLMMGASRRAIIATVAGRGVALVTAGGVVGVASAMALARWLSSLLYGVTASDPSTVLLALGAIAGAGIAACVVPVWTAIAVAPAEILREQ